MESIIDIKIEPIDFETSNISEAQNSEIHTPEIICSDNQIFIKEELSCGEDEDNINYLQDEEENIIKGYTVRGQRNEKGYIVRGQRNEKGYIVRPSNEKDLTEETQSILAALDAIRKMKSGHGVVTKPQMDDIRTRIICLSEKYSIKCLESAALKEKLDAVNKQLVNANTQICYLEARNKQLITHLSDKVSEDQVFSSEYESTENPSEKDKTDCEYAIAHCTVEMDAEGPDTEYVGAFSNSILETNNSSFVSGIEDSPSGLTKSDLPPGWTQKCVERKCYAGAKPRMDYYYTSPTGKRFRSKTEVIKYCQDEGLQVDLQLFGFPVENFGSSVQVKSLDNLSNLNTVSSQPITVSTHNATTQQQTTLFKVYTDTLDLSQEHPVYNQLVEQTNSEDSPTNSPNKMRRKRVACTCPNCLVGGRGGNKKKSHICHIPGCKKVYQKTSHLRAHLCKHSGEMPFTCSLCHQSFTRSDELSRHMRNHTGEKPFECSECFKSFKRSDHLSKHFKTHTKLKYNVHQ